MRSTILSLSFCGNNDWRRGGGQGLRATAGGEQCDGAEGTDVGSVPILPKRGFETAKHGEIFTKNGISSIEMWISSMHEAWGEIHTKGPTTTEQP